MLRPLLYTAALIIGVTGLLRSPPFRLGSGASVSPPELAPALMPQPLNLAAPSAGAPSTFHAAAESHALRPSLRGSCYGHALCQPVTSTRSKSTAPLTLPLGLHREDGGSPPAEANDPSYNNTHKVDSNARHFLQRRLRDTKSDGDLVSHSSTPYTAYIFGATNSLLHNYHSLDHQD